jgi:hypothetical protein
MSGISFSIFQKRLAFGLHHGKGGAVGFYRLIAYVPGESVWNDHQALEEKEVRIV